MRLFSKKTIHVSENYEPFKLTLEESSMENMSYRP